MLSAQQAAWRACAPGTARARSLSPAPTPAAGRRSLRDVGPQADRLLAQRVQVDRRLAPAQKLQAELGDGLLEQLLAALAMDELRSGMKSMPTARSPGAGADRSWPARARHQLVRKLGQNACAVAGTAIGGNSPAMRVVTEGLEGQFEHAMGALAAAQGDKTRAARIVLERGVVQGAGPTPGQLRLSCIPFSGWPESQ